MKRGSVRDLVDRRVTGAVVGRDGEAVARRELLDRVWGGGQEVGSNVVDRVVYGLRRKLGERADRLETVRGVGYRLRRD